MKLVGTDYWCGVFGVAACGGAGRGYDHYTGTLRSVPSNSV